MADKARSQSSATVRPPPACEPYVADDWRSARTYLRSKTGGRGTEGRGFESRRSDRSFQWLSHRSLGVTPSWILGGYHLHCAAPRSFGAAETSAVE
jgi:hypothetical protein